MTTSSCTESGFSTVLDVYDHLRSSFKISRSALYMHTKDGKLRRNADGVFTQRAVDRYARTFLPRLDSGQIISKDLEDLQRRKLEAEIRLKELQAARVAHEQAVAEGKYLPREDFELELAARASVFDAGFRYFFQALAGEVVALVSGDSRKVPELVAMLNDRLDEQLNEYASTREYHVMIVGPESEDDSPVPPTD